MQKKTGSLEKRTGYSTPCFDISGIVIPIGFKPTSSIFEQNDPVQNLIGRIAAARNVPEMDVVAEMNGIIKEGFDGNLLPPAALVLIAKKYGVPFDDLGETLSLSMDKA